MHSYFRITSLYMLAGTLLTLLLQDEPLMMLLKILGLAISFARLMGDMALTALPFLAPLFIWFWRRIPKARLRPMLIVAVGSIWLQVGFLLFKSAIPAFVPFYADPFFAGMDRALLFGHDAWELAHAVIPEATVSWLLQFYLTPWSVLAYCLPVLVTATDPDESRVLRYIWLFFLSWLVAGNIIALIGSSVGPVYYDRLLGTERFAALHASFAATGYSDQGIAFIQDQIWEKSGGTLSFISAFPSVHVAVATVAALYIRERFRRFHLIGDLFFALILLISVYSGYHYLVDGIASVVIVLGLNSALRRRLAGSALLPVPAEEVYRTA